MWGIEVYTVQRMFLNERRALTGPYGPGQPGASFKELAFLPTTPLSGFVGVFLVPFLSPAAQT